MIQVPEPCSSNNKPRGHHFGQQLHQKTMEPLHNTTSRRPQNPNKNLPTLVNWCYDVHPFSHPNEPNSPPSFSHGSSPRTNTHYLPNLSRNHDCLRYAFNFHLYRAHRPLPSSHIPKTYKHLPHTPTTNRGGPCSECVRHGHFSTGRVKTTCYSSIT